jgi:uncharacterized membrane protein (UPF0127 family)
MRPKSIYFKIIHFKSLTNMANKYLVVLVASWLLGQSNLGFAQNNKLGVIELKTGIYRIEAEIADTLAARLTGLMYRTYLPMNAGMLFVFEEKAIHCFNMRNTKIPLSIAFLDYDGKIVSIADMEPETLNHHCPRSAVSYAIEMNQKWFAQRAIGPGTVIQGLPKK